MKATRQFMKGVDAILAQIDPAVLSRREEEFWIIKREYEYLEYYANVHQYQNTAIALRLAVGLHNGSYRKSTITRDGESYRLPYVIHCLWVTKMLADLSIPMPAKEYDILLASALCHDMIEDVDFEDGGRELYTKYHLDPQVYQTVKLVSKRYDFTEQEEKDFFHHIESNKLSLLVKLSDRCHNIEDLYNRSSWKVHEYIGETKKFFIPMCEYGLTHYPELLTTLQILMEKMNSLSQAAEILVDYYEAREKALTDELQSLQKENAQLRQQWMKLWYQKEV